MRGQLKPILEVREITKKFGNLVANENVSFTIGEREIVSLIGPNGAGKTTLFNSISGFYPPTSGSVFFEGKDITGLPSYEVCRLGLTRTFQIVQTLKEMTVEENVMTGAFLHTRSTRAARAAAREILELVGMSGKRDILGGSLTIVDKKRLEIARALATKPKLLMLDECMAGLNQTEIKDESLSEAARKRALPADRGAHHGGDHADLRPDRGAQRGKEDRRGSAEGNCRQ